MKPKRKSPLAQLIASHKNLLKAFRKQTEEIGYLRRMILEIHEELPKQAWTDGKYRTMRTGDTIQHGDKTFNITETRAKPLHGPNPWPQFANHRHQASATNPFRCDKCGVLLTSRSEFGFNEQAIP